MKHYFVLFCTAILLCNHSFAQKNDYGFTAGLVLSKPNDYHCHTGFFIGMESEHSLLGNDSYLYLNPSLYLIQKGWNDDIYDLDDNKYNWKCDLYYIELPLTTGYKYAATKTTRLFCEAGPYVAYGITGKSKAKTKEDKYENSVFSSGAYKRFDWGIKLAAGIDIAQWQICMAWESSMKKPTEGGWNAINPKDKSWLLQVSYFITR